MIGSGGTALVQPQNKASTTSNTYMRNVIYRAIHLVGATVVNQCCAVLLTVSLGAISVCEAEHFHRILTANATITVSLCFYEAFLAKHEKRISEQE